MKKQVKIKRGVYTGASNANFVEIFGQIVDAILAHSDVFLVIPFLPAFLLERVAAITSKTRAAVLGSTAQKDERSSERSRCTVILDRLGSAVIDRALEEDS